ncbi:MAG: hypothetical protein RLY86_2237 [Pseudomonadota bacterium]|jgi:SAM-dependent methyltransferase
MSTWTAGYVTDVSYTHGFYRELTPTMLSFAALAKGYRAPNVNSPISYCELGCGQGFSTNLLAAANPSIQFYATDFNPAHIVGACNLSKAAGTMNVAFFDDSFESFGRRTDLPQFDIIALHGVYSWISQQNRQRIINFIREKLKVGGLVFISYNALPGWAAAMPLRRLFVDFSDQSSGSSLRRVDAALAAAERVASLPGGYFGSMPSVKQRLEKIKAQPKTYLAHEYFNADWSCFYHADVADDLAEAKLTWIAPAHLLEGVDPVNLSIDHLKLLSEVECVSHRETLRDFLTNQQFRRDVFARGATRFSLTELRDVWAECMFALTSSAAMIPFKVNGPIGEATLQEDVYRPVIDAFSSGPAALGDVMNASAMSALGWARVMQAITVLVGMGHMHPCLSETKVNAYPKNALRFNEVILNQARSSSEFAFLASPVTGGGVPVDQISQLFLLAGRKPQLDPVQFVWAALKSQGQCVLRAGVRLTTEEENLSEIRVLFENFRSTTMPLLHALGVVEVTR